MSIETEDKDAAFRKWKESILAQEPKETGCPPLPETPSNLSRTKTANILNGERHFIGDCDYCDEALDGLSMKERLSHYVRHEREGIKPIRPFGLPDSIGE